MADEIIDSKNDNFQAVFPVKEENLSEHDNQGLVISKHLSIWNWETDSNGVYISCDSEVFNLLGFSRNEVIGQPFFSFGLDTSAQKLLREGLQEGKFPISIDLIYLSKNNELRPFGVTIMQNYSQDGVLVGYKGYSQELENRTDQRTRLDEFEVLEKNKSDSSADDKNIRKHTRPLVAESLPEREPSIGLDKKPRSEITPQIVRGQKGSKIPKYPDFKNFGKTAPLNYSFNEIPQANEVVSTPPSLESIKGVVLQDGNFDTSEKIWSSHAITSFQTDQAISKSYSEGEPAIIATPVKLPNRKVGVIEIMDLEQNRKWTEEERILVQEVAAQLGLAIENAQLYSTVQKELSDRVKAEEETRKRNFELGKLNQVMQQLTRLVSHDEIFKIVSKTIQDLMGTGNILIALLDQKTNRLLFPVCLSDGNRIDLPDRDRKSGYQEKILHNRIPLLIEKDAKSVLENSFLDHPRGIPLSLLAVPMLTGDRSLGVITVFDYRQEYAFDEIQSEILSTVAAQTATALENANLFNEIRQALDTIEVRERYQSNVTEAVAALSDRGSKSINFILEKLAVASKADRVSFLEYDPNTSIGLGSWKITSTYRNPEIKVRTSSLTLSSFAFVNAWMDSIKQNGYFEVDVENASDSTRQILETRKAKSLLLLSVGVEDNIQGIIAFEHLTTSHHWKEDEIGILQIGTNAFSNTLVREGLLQQVQNSLNETENLYSASHNLALANTIPDMIAAIVEGIDIQSINRGVLVMFTYSSDDQITTMNVTANYYNGMGTPPPPVGTEYLASLYRPIFAIKNPVFYDDLMEAEIDPSLARILTKQNIRAMGILPLWSGNLQLGVLLIQSSTKYSFGSQEMRSFPPLVDQMSTAIENLRLFEQTQQALSETELLYKISNGVSRATELDEFVKLVGKNALPKNADSIWLLSSNQKGDSPVFDFEVIGSSDLSGRFNRSGELINSEAFNFLEFSDPEPVVITNIDKTELTGYSRAMFRKLGLRSAALIPLRTTGNLLGFFITGASKPCEMDTNEIHTLKIVGNSVAVAIERQKLLSEAQRRALELQSAAEIARDTTSTLSLDILLHRIVHLLRDRFSYYQCSLFLLDEAGTHAVIQESTGDVGAELKRIRYKLAIGSKSIVGTCISKGEPVLVNDVTKSPIYFANTMLPETRSELALPIKISGKVIGVIDLQAKKVDTFSDAELTVLQILTDQVAVAIDNARAYEVSQKAVEEMREIDRVKSQFLANMSHELRTPLNSVIGFSRVILKGIDGPINDVQEQDITAIYNSGMHLLNMINEILDMSKIEAGKMELQVDDINLNDTINAALATSAGLVKDKPIELKNEVPQNLPVIQGDEIRISQVLINLISNAVKFTEKGAITISAKTQKNMLNNPEVMITVADTGIGIAPEDQIKLFQRFSQVDDSPTRKTGGTGLGLSICRSFIELHGGKIGLLSSEVGKGSTFYFTLPAPDTSASNTTSPETAFDNIILSIDDDIQVIELYQRFLKKQGYEVIPLTDPAQAVEKAKNLKPFAITLDIMMPRIDGWQVLSELKKDEETRNIPVMICSILEEEEKGFSLGATEYLVKPFLQDDLGNAIHRLNKNGEIHDILIIDDDLTNLEMIKEMIEAEGNYLPILAEGGKQALSLLKELTPDMVILDLFMPNINGFEILDHMKTETRLANIPVLALTDPELEVIDQKMLAEYDNQIVNRSTLNKNDLLEKIQQTIGNIRPTRLLG